MPSRSFAAPTALVACLILGTALAAPPATRPSRCDKGVLRWVDDGTEVALFGVNYYAPFSIDWQALQRHHVDPADALRTDLVHLRRLGLEALRLHCWDREISDPEGNLVDNDHLRLLDLLIAEAANQGIYTVLTPIAWWGAADPATNGFSNRFSMPQMTSEPEARACQVRYLAQFVAHTNRFTGQRYADDPRIIAFELINEPIYPPDTSDDAVVAYINALAAAVRSTGCTKPVLYNCWGGREDAAARSSLDGVTFGWYPTGLASGRTLTENLLPTLDRHHSAHTPCLDHLLKAVYEFDAADVHGTFMYPAMAREFRSAGIQVATQFQYDAMALAANNENWQTHYLNLVYAPGKTMSFAIAAEAFRQIPRLATFPPHYPDNRRFANARVSFEEDLSEWVSDSALLYANTTTTLPPAPGSLQRVWGVGSSPVVTYPGTGAYFLDRGAAGVWRLQVYPDAVVVADPYSGGTAEKVRLLWATHPMSVRLADLGEGFTCRREDSPGPVQNAVGTTLELAPGSYLLARQGLTPAALPEAVPYLTPPPSQESATPAARLTVPGLWRQGQPLGVRLTVAAGAVEGCQLGVLIPGESEFRYLPLAPVGAYRYQADLPAAWLQPGRMLCVAEVKVPAAVFRFPAGTPVGKQPRLPRHELLTVAAATPLPPLEGGGWLRGQPKLESVAGPAADRYAIHLEAEGFGEPPACVGMRLPVRPPDAAAQAYNALSLTLRGGPSTHLAEVTLVQDDGAAFGADASVSPTWRTTSIPLASLQPKWGTAGTLQLQRVSKIAVVFGAWLFPGSREETHWVEVAAAGLSQDDEGVPVRVLAAAAPLLLTVPSAQPVRATGHDAAALLVPGPSDESEALRVAVGGFGPAPDCCSVRLPVPSSERAALAAQRGDGVIVVPLRAGAPRTDKVEVVVLERDGTPWGAVLPLTREWNRLLLKPADLRFFSHWQHPEGRGGPEDRIRLDQIDGVNLCFGAWLYGDAYASPHAIEVGEITLEPGG